MNDFYLKSSHRLKAIRGPLKIIVNSIYLDFIARRGSETHSQTKNCFS